MPHLKAKSPRNLLRLLAAHSKRVISTSSGTLPFVRMTVASGAEFSGWLLDLGSDANSESVVLNPSKFGDQLENELVYVSIDNVLSVHLQNARDFLSLLSDGAIARVLGEVAPTRLALRRSLQEELTRLNVAQKLDLKLLVDFEKLSERDAVLLNVRDLCTALALALTEINQDKMGHAALVAHSEFRIEPCQGLLEMSVVREGGAVVLKIDLDRALPVELVQTLSKNLSAVL